MPNMRHPTRKYIGFWGTDGLKQKLQKLATKGGTTLSVLITKILWDFVNGADLILLLLLQP
jgi:hypothetical protein